MVNTSSCMILDLDLVRMKPDDVNFSSEYKITCNRNDTFSGVVTWFDTGFTDLKNPTWLSTSPFKKYTHWKQTTFYADSGSKVERDDVIYGSVCGRQSKANHRELDVKMSYHIENRKTETHQVCLYKMH
jgi:hypothetical protein